MSKKTIVAPEAKFENQRTELDESDLSVVEAESKTQADARHRNAMRKFEIRKRFISLAAQIAEDNLFITNVKYPGADKTYPDPKDADFRYVNKMYPNAKGGPLYVDEPITERDMLRSYARQKIIKKLGLRYIVIEKDSTLEDCWVQLGEF